MSDRPWIHTPAHTDVNCFYIPGRGEITVSGDGGWEAYEYQLQKSWKCATEAKVSDGSSCSSYVVNLFH